MDLTTKQQQIMDADGHILVTGGPGSGKTTISILKAAKLTASLRMGQRILFLSFARATVSRVVEAIDHEQKIPREQKQRIEVDTYHSFFLGILKTHGYLIGLPRKLHILTTATEAVLLAKLRGDLATEAKLRDITKAERKERENSERLRLALEEGRICFDLFAPFVAQILNGSVRIRKLIAASFPIVILDEFQDTNLEQWNVVKAIGQNCKLLALADPEQRIYDWIGADPERLNHFRKIVNPVEIDLGTDNHRSAGTEISLFGNDVLTGDFTKKNYDGVACRLYGEGSAQAWTALVTQTYEARKRLIDAGIKNWSLAILVPTKKLTRLVSDNFRFPPAGMTEVRHTAVIEMEGAILGAEVIAFMMQPADGLHFEQFIHLLCNYYLGRGGSDPTQGDIKEAAVIQNAYSDWLNRCATGKAIKKNSVLVAVLDTYAGIRALHFTGDPDKDWNSVRRIFENGSCARLKTLAEDARNIRVLERGEQLRELLSQDWRENQAYRNSLKIVRQAFVREYFAIGKSKPESGVVVMNMHKAKGKQFDEVIIFESGPKKAGGKIVANVDRIVWNNSGENCDSQARQNMRVSITRGKMRVTILTPKSDPCVILMGKKGA